MLPKAVSLYGMKSLTRSILRPKEIAESNMRVAFIMELIKARQKQGIGRRQLDTLLKVLAPLSKTLAIVPLQF